MSLPSLPQAISLGGPIVKSPKIIPVVWTSDPLASEIDTWLAAWEKTTYWADAVAEYGIGKPAVGATVRIADAPAATLDGVDIEKWLASRLDGTHPEFPAPDASTFFMLVYPPGTTITQKSVSYTSCKEFHGYHQSTKLPSGLDVPYAVLSRCDSLPEVAVTGIQYVAAVASHEVLEGLADPVPDRPAFAEVDPAHRAWSLVTGGEIGDLCALQGNAFYEPSDFPYTVQKMWSNAAALAGKDPCAPETPGEPYVVAVPRLEDPIPLPTGRASGVRVPVGQERQVQVDVYADGAVSGPVKLRAMEVRGTGHLTFSFDRSTASPGESVTLTIKRTSTSAEDADLFTVATTVGARPRPTLTFGAVAH